MEENWGGIYLAVDRNRLKNRRRGIEISSVSRQTSNNSENVDRILKTGKILEILLLVCYLYAPVCHENHVYVYLRQ